MKAIDLRVKSALLSCKEELVALLKEQFSLRMQLAAQQLANNAQLGRASRYRARSYGDA